MTNILTNNFDSTLIYIEIIHIKEQMAMIIAINNFQSKEQHKNDINIVSIR